jgi:hypothetical protein
MNMPNKVLRNKLVDAIPLGLSVDNPMMTIDRLMPVINAEIRLAIAKSDQAHSGTHSLDLALAKARLEGMERGISAAIGLPGPHDPFWKELGHLRAEVAALEKAGEGK